MSEEEDQAKEEEQNNEDEPEELDEDKNKDEEENINKEENDEEKETNEKNNDENKIVEEKTNEEQTTENAQTEEKNDSKKNPQILKKELTFYSKKLNNGNVNDISFSKQGYFEENNEIPNQNLNPKINKINSNMNYNPFLNSNNNNNNINNYNNFIPKKSTKQLLNEINSDMDVLSNSLNPIFKRYEIQQEIKMYDSFPMHNNYNFPIHNNYNFPIHDNYIYPIHDNYNYPMYDNDSYYSNDDDESDVQNYEIKRLINKAKYYNNNNIINPNRYNHYQNHNHNHNYNGRYSQRSHHYKKKNYYNNYHMRENGGNYNNRYVRKDYNYPMDRYNNRGYLRNISLDKNINKNRIKRMGNLYANRNSYTNRPLIYSQRETLPIKNSYMNEILGMPQTSQKIEYPNWRNNLIFSSNKMPYKKIKNGNINQSLDVLFSQRK